MLSSIAGLSMALCEDKIDLKQKFIVSIYRYMYDS